MNKLFCFLILIFLIIAGIGIVAAISITGYATSQQASLNITITVPSPNITLISPLNHTYINRTAIQLNFTSSNTWKIWYNLDGNTNITITAPLTFETTNGVHTLYLYANNTANEIISRNITFSVNESFFSVNYSAFRNNGNSTNIDSLSFQELQNISQFTLDNAGYSKIVFRESVNLTNSISSSLSDINLALNLSNNSIILNSSQIPGLNRSATLTLRSLSFSNPRILRDGNVCSESICSKQSYVLGNLVFNVSSFSTYSAEETPGSSESSGSSSGGGGGGGGGGGTPSANALTVSEDQLSIKLKQGGTSTAQVILVNTGLSRISVALSAEKITQFVKFESATIELGPGESKELDLVFLARHEDQPGITIGKIILQTGGVKREILTSIEIVSPDALMDVQVEIPFKFLSIQAGETLLVSTRLFNLGQTQKIDVLVNYEIRDSENQQVYTEHETVAVETQASFIKSILLPEGLPPGEYAVYATAVYEGKTASGSAWFTIANAQQALMNKLLLITLAAVLVLTILVVIYVMSRRPKFTNPKIPKWDLKKDKLK